MKLVITTDTCLKALPVCLSQEAKNIPEQFAQLRKGTELDIVECFLYKGDCDTKAGDYLMVQLAGPLEKRQNLLWFIENSHAKIVNLNSSGESIAKFDDEGLKSGYLERPGNLTSYRVAPWIMCPNTLAPAEVYACETDNSQCFLSDLNSALNELRISLKVVSKQENRSDRWIQEEIELGYIQGLGHTIPVVFDSSHGRNLDDFSKINPVDPYFGRFQVGNSFANSLDSFGNLEVSPPVAIRGRHYPFGRIVFGGRRPGDDSKQSRQMMPELRHFLYAQKVQSPFELYTDWLTIGHVGEIISFVPANNDKGFQILIASPLNANIILVRLANRGFADTVMFEGVKRPDHSSPSGTFHSAEITIGEILQDTTFWEANERYQGYIDHNIRILRQELGVNGHHLVNIPVLFHLPFADGRTTTYFPNMVDHLVLGDSSLVPKPKGPIINGKCAFETAFEHAVPERKVRFIDNWHSYHRQFGETRFGINIRRHPFPMSVTRDIVET